MFRRLRKIIIIIILVSIFSSSISIIIIVIVEGFELLGTQCAVENGPKWKNSTAQRTD